MQQVAAVFQVSRLQGGVLAVEAALDLFADDEGHAAGAVVGAGAVVHGAASELGVEQRYDVVADVVVAQVGHEGVNVAGHVVQQVGLAHGLVGVGVEDVVGGRREEHAGAQVGVMHLYHVAHVPADVAQQVLFLAAVHGRGR